MKDVTADSRVSGLGSYEQSLWRQVTGLPRDGAVGWCSGSVPPRPCAPASRKGSTARSFGTEVWVLAKVEPTTQVGGGWTLVRRHLAVPLVAR